MIRRDKFLIGSRYVDPASSEVLKVISPITEDVIGEVPLATTADMDRAVAVARRAFEEGPWPKMSIAQRGEYLERLVELLEPHISEARNLQIAEMGGPLKLYGPQTPAMLGPRILDAIAVAKTATLQEIRQGSYGKVVVSRTPLGVVGAIIPWNTPIAGLIIKMLPALLAGTPVILKPAPESPLSCYIIADALAKLGLPEGVVSIIPAGREVGEYLVSHRGVDKISFTGSTAAGRRIGAICGEQIKPVTLELGGKSAAILLDDFNLERTLPILERNSLTNTGQICIATTRILVSERRHDELVDALIARVEKMKVGNPFEADTDFGPLAAERQRERVESFIKAGRDAGAKVALGGGRPAIEKGWFVEPTIFTGVDNSMAIAREEIFGPVLSIIRYKDEAEAVRIANDSAYGLGGAVYSSDIARGLSIAAQLETGSCVVNEGVPGGGGGPFGGVKLSGIGREQGLEGLYNHYYLKSVTVPMGVEPVLEPVA
ncbi:aldehyde dehydrogenase [Sphingobium sp. TKS]|uniref:aldehyde dehydrogenase n=1 Tax=Sphingobium sp. TKS TaxID=1315974 RepID=UPI00077063DF|nr:aldehyde dehydrogenase [Sphingobium sp. TKS]AMK25627.1 aldehyde dehydrogenase [Sphingobium sp. TKS]